MNKKQAQTIVELATNGHEQEALKLAINLSKTSKLKSLPSPDFRTLALDLTLLMGRDRKIKNRIMDDFSALLQRIIAERSLDTKSVPSADISEVLEMLKGSLEEGLELAWKDLESKLSL